MAGLRKQRFSESGCDNLSWMGVPALSGEEPVDPGGYELPRVPSHGPTEKHWWKVTCLFGLLLPDVGLTDSEVSSSSAEAQEDKSYMEKRFFWQLRVPEP